MAMFKKIAAAAAAAAVVFSFSAAADAAQTLRVGSLTVYAPFEYVNSQNGEYEGFDMDLIREIGRRKGFDVQIISMTLDGLVPALVSGNIDAAVSALTITPERAEIALRRNRLKRRIGDEAYPRHDGAYLQFCCGCLFGTQ